MQGVSDAVRAATGRDGAVATWVAEPLDHHVDNMTTERLDRVRGTLVDGTSWSLVAKTLRPASDSPQCAMTGDVAALVEVDAGVVDAFCRGVAAVGGAADRAEVELTYRVTLAVRSALPCLDVGHAADLPDEQRVALLRQRTALARIAVDRLATVTVGARHRP